MKFVELLVTMVIITMALGMGLLATHENESLQDTLTIIGICMIFVNIAFLFMLLWKEMTRQMR